MELWIRSQDRIALTKINSIGIEYDKKLVGYGKVCVKLGEYKSKERALEVLDEIQKKIKGTYLIKSKTDLVESRFYEAAKKYHSEENDINIVCGDGMFDIIPINTDFIVYEMPEE